VTSPPYIRFYAGAPLVTADARIRLGSLCVIDLEPRDFDAEQCMVLANFAEVVVREIEKEKLRVRRGSS
jgi:GAF domain-containing protein